MSSTYIFLALVTSGIVTFAIRLFINAPFGIPELIAVALVVLLQWWKENTLLSIFVPTIIYMVLLQVM